MTGYGAALVANSILHRAFADDVPVSPLKLQRILFFTAARYARLTGRPLLGEQFQPWPYGPVVPSVHGQFRRESGGRIQRYAKDAEGRAHMLDTGSDRALRAALDDVWAATRFRSGFALSELSRAEGGAWWVAFQSDARYLDDDLIARDASLDALLGLAASVPPSVGTAH